MFTNNKISVGEPFFNSTTIPIMAPAILIMGIGKEIFTFYAILPLGAAFGYALASITVKLFPSEINIQILLKILFEFEL